MSAERSCALLLNELEIPTSLPVPQGYYRSKLFAALPATNPILAAASPLFSLLERFSATQTLPHIDAIKENIDHEWKSYRSRLASLKYTEEFVVVAEYLMSATIDELIGKTYLRMDGKAAEFISFTPSSLSDAGPEKHFFDIVTIIKDRAYQYLDLIELAYYCLICGFEGEHHLRADGRNTLDNLIHELYELIQQHRVHKPIRLFKEPQPIIQTHQDKYHPILWKSMVFGMGALIALYFISQGVLDYQAKILYTEQTKRMQLDH